MTKGKGFQDRGKDSRDKGKAAQEAKIGKGKSSQHILRKAGSGGNPNQRDERRQ